MKYVVAAALSVLLVLLAGCGGDPQPRFSPSTSPAATTTRAAAVETPQEFLRRWVRAMDEMEWTGRPTPWEALNLASCENCAAVAASVRGFYAKGFHVVGSHSQVLAVSEVAGKWRLELMTRPTRVLDGQGRPHGKFDGGRVIAVVRLARSHGRFRVADYYREGP